jgi:Zn-dependent protease
MKLLLLLLSAGKLGKILTTGGTMLVSVFAYALVFGWRYAAGFVALLFCHEMGHFVAARRSGLPVGVPTFIPFVGAWIEMKEMPKDARTEAYVAIAGPVAGTLAALACFAAARASGSQLLLALAYAGFFLNLFNLIPLSPLDGGRITAILSPRIWLLGAPILAAVFLWRPSPVLVMIGIVAIPQLMKAWHYDPAAPENQAYYGVSNEDRLTYGAFYVGLIVFLGLMTHDLNAELGTLGHHG